MSSRTATRLAWAAVWCRPRARLCVPGLRRAQPRDVRHDRIDPRGRDLRHRRPHVSDHRGARRLAPAREPDRLDLRRRGSPVRAGHRRRRVCRVCALDRAGLASSGRGNGVAGVVALPRPAHPGEHAAVPALSERPPAVEALVVRPLVRPDRDGARPARRDVHPWHPRGLRGRGEPVCGRRRSRRCARGRRERRFRLDVRWHTRLGDLAPAAVPPLERARAPAAQVGRERSRPRGRHLRQRPAPVLVHRHQRRPLGGGHLNRHRHDPGRGRDRYPPLPALRARSHREPGGCVRCGLGASRRRVLRDRARPPGSVLVLRRRLRPGHRRLHARRRRALPSRAGPSPADSRPALLPPPLRRATNARGLLRPAARRDRHRRRSRASSPPSWGGRSSPLGCRSGCENRRSSDEPAATTRLAWADLDDRDRAVVRRARLPDPQPLDAGRRATSDHPASATPCSEWSR